MIGERWKSVAIIIGYRSVCATKTENCNRMIDDLIHAFFSLSPNKPGYGSGCACLLVPQYCFVSCFGFLRFVPPTGEALFVVNGGQSSW
ncbi:hypothetical protein P8452_41546 [Trifolium repens]|nr:hypothetical protein P8452_41546 [Trifolium repens]